MEHILPEAIGNDDLILAGEVCDKCNQYFGSKIEQFVLEKTPLAFWRTFLGIRTKHGSLPNVNLSQPTKQKGTLPSTHRYHDDYIVKCHKDLSVSFDIKDYKCAEEIKEGKKKYLTFVFTPLVLHKLGRFFCKVGIELICLDDSKEARSRKYDAARRFARYGEFRGLWPIFHQTVGRIEDLVYYAPHPKGIAEKAFCYSYSLGTVAGKFDLLSLVTGTDHWMICLNNPFPTAEISQGLANKDLNILWYHPESIRLKG